MNNNFFKTIVLLLFLCLQFFISKYAISEPLSGAGSSGGGQSVIMPAGVVKFLDFVSPNNIKNLEKNDANTLKQLYFTNNTVVSQLAYQSSDFFSCGKNIIASKMKDFPALENIYDKLKDINPYLVEFPIFNDTTTQFTDVYNLPIIARPSKSIPKEYQFPVASYVNGKLWISKRLYEQFTEEEKCGLQIHEILRHLNYTGNIITPLETNEIEAMTRYLLNKSFDQDKNILITAKYKLQNTILHDSDYLFKQASKLFKEHNELSKIIQNPSCAGNKQLELYKLSYLILDSAQAYQRLAIESKNKEVRPNVDAISNAFFVDEKKLFKKGSWDLKKIFQAIQ